MSQFLLLVPVRIISVFTDTPRRILRLLRLTALHPDRLAQAHAPDLHTELALTEYAAALTATMVRIAAPPLVIGSLTRFFKEKKKKKQNKTKEQKHHA